jgi:hypothetical protein
VASDAKGVAEGIPVLIETPCDTPVVEALSCGSGIRRALAATVGLPVAADRSLSEFTSIGMAHWRGDPRIAGARRTARGTPDGPDQLALASPALRMNCAAGGLAAASLYVITVLKTDND